MKNVRWVDSDGRVFVGTVSDEDVRRYEKNQRTAKQLGRYAAGIKWCGIAIAILAPAIVIIALLE